ncbi:peptidoglycan DD-metalloendopeptidase family protein [Thalassospira sp.]|uniref:peptidoglycan DD-metalloendopeptidase family protein n=1 Tax=Thalassospira sp. TaxID=1912094 RepID=UPI002732C692|nr:peptidoglycan DD-metalloendopeptidase family protein [Thalassospira sp.]MDP2698007.1 peptidoglycan DD-metalloendopeptidase family protein [Thalassospira sp.]
MTVIAPLPADQRFARYVERHARGEEALPDAQNLRQWIMDHQGDFASVLTHDLTRCRKIVYDFSRNGDVVIGGDSDPARQTEIMFDQMAQAGAPVGVGRYREDRVCYQSPQFTKGGEARSQHLGIDLFLAAGTPVFMPLEGVVHSFADNNLPLDYGPTIIMEHNPEPGVRFWTLYGHLSRESLIGLKPGRVFGKGEKLCEFGDFPINGDWIPHLHFQIIFDLLDRAGDYFGAARPSEWDIWESICPNANLILCMPENVTAGRDGL